MELSNSIIILSALAHESRLLIFKQLVQADLVNKNKQGRSIYYSAQYQTIDEPVVYLKKNCCSGGFC